MKLQDSVTLPCDRATAWAALNDPDVLRRCIPGCEVLEQDAPDHLRAKVVLKVGPIKARFAGDVTLTDITPPQSYVLTGEGKGGVAGFAKGSARVWLDEVAPQETVLNYDASADVGGKLAQLGSRLLDSTAQKLVRQFFDSFRACVSQTDADAVAAKP
ncbi:carbon monoxide dehydrogenase subunit G [Pseudohalocynthiibacter aestuariivivens]|uniref:Carbon monoxide dehydrogenase subunit G n=1 Tax=Roseovarius pelagicus TaxID=2980108 RepID=A0ABY6DDB2_9RHOB|nr:MULTISPECIES: carbon monoxide dehydrogenase subunit G [Rhodobacterales]QIE47303.1 carbon monoxide dehydrogenase subunit G [Pseudohalocynthiibacter aestuariivivens]UXX84137.1 carbon monoxide dehydrogenase subunit G [Roseovarius pelagicus]